MLVSSACPKMEFCIAFRQMLGILGIESPLQRAFYTKQLSNDRQFHPSACHENTAVNLGKPLIFMGLRVR